MKKYFSVFCLLVRMKLKKVLVFLIAIPVVSLLIYHFFFLGVEEVETGSFQLGKAYLSMYIPFMIGSLGVAFSCLDFMPGKSRRRYLLARLRISEQAVFAWEAAACAIIFLLLWQVEIITVTAAGLMHNRSAFNQAGSFDVVLAVYVNKLYKSVVPLSNPGVWANNICGIVFCGISCACINLYPGESSSRALGIVALVVTAVFYVGDVSIERIFFGGLFAAIAAFLSGKRLHNGKARNENEAMDC